MRLEATSTANLQMYVTAWKILGPYNLTWAMQ